MYASEVVAITCHIVCCALDLGDVKWCFIGDGLGVSKELEHGQLEKRPLICTYAFDHSHFALHPRVWTSPHAILFVLKNSLHATKFDMSQICDLGLARDIESGCRELTEYVVTRWYRAPEIMLACQEYSKVSRERTGSDTFKHFAFDIS